MDEDAVWRVIDEERSRLADLMEDLSEPEWRTPSLCSEWTVREVAAHLTLAHTGPLSATVSLIRAGGGFNRMIRDTAIRQARLPVREYPRRLRAMVGSRRTAPFITAFEPMIDVLCHAQDIARPIGRPYPMPTAPAAAAADRIWRQSFPFQAQRRLRGFELVATDAPWRAGGGVRVEGPIAALLLLVSGRPAAVADLTGPGAAKLAGTYRRHAGLARPPRPSTTTDADASSPKERS
ncbi:MAG TPA: maleylpyruvate isomerase family mycothiol-dependent enzyme [Micromonosporaceae bacterium]|nr:maleylpyruvate isomerase family mycothiol-dependent enzyme [Micromonosporaceae bacterium]